jgi:hypothetical protein
MANGNGRKWYRDPRIIIPAIVVILAALIAGITNIIVSGPEPDFSMSIYPSTGETFAGGTSQTLVTIESIGGYEHHVNLEAIEPPEGIVTTFIPKGGPAPPYSSTMNMNVAEDIPVGVYKITIQGLGADGIEHTCKYSLTVLPKPDFNISVNPGRGEVGQGNVIETTISIASTQGYEHSISLSASGQPSGVLITFTPPTGEPTPSFTSTMTINVDGDTPAGDYSITVTGIGTDGKVNSVEYNLTVSEPSVPIVITITSHENGDMVPISTTVRGTISGDLPEGQYMWVVINPHPSPGQWWPQVGRIEPLKDQWYVEVWLGRETEDIGNEFDIAVILVNEEDDQAYRDYLTIGEATGDYPGIPLPPSADVMAIVTVIRK